MILQADSWPVLLELFLSKLLVSDYLMTVFDEKCSLKSVRYPIISPSILYTHHLGISFTSSTAQGGGGSFKNRKPIGELGCCE